MATKAKKAAVKSKGISVQMWAVIVLVLGLASWAFSVWRMGTREWVAVAVGAAIVVPVVNWLETKYFSKLETLTRVLIGVLAVLVLGYVYGWVINYLFGFCVLDVLGL